MKKTFYSFAMMAATTVLVLLGVAACSSGGGGSSSTTTVAAAGTCTTAGYVYSSQYGCIPQSTCPSGYGMYNNTCVVATLTTTGTCAAGSVYSAQYGCLVQGSCQSGYALYNNQCTYVGTSSTSICPAGYINYNGTCMIGTATSTTTNTCQNSCAVGSVQTVYGCLPQATCASCYGYYNHYCIGGALTGGSWYYNPY